MKSPPVGLHRTRGSLGAGMRGAAHVRPEILAHGDCGFFESFEKLLLDLFLLAVAADEVADELAGVEYAPLSTRDST